MKVWGFAPLGYEGELVRVEVDVRKGIPGLEIVGLATSAVKEARERIRIALKNSGFQYPSDRVLINLSPADLPKIGSGYDLPMTIGILSESGQLTSAIEEIAAIGEVGLDGSIRSVEGVLPAVARGKEAGIRTFAVPLDNVEEARCLEGVDVIGVRCVEDLVRSLSEPHTIRRSSVLGEGRVPKEIPRSIEFRLRGQSHASFAVAVAAAGGHSALFYGPPGSGKTLAAKTLERLLPDLSERAALEKTRIWSLAGKLSNAQGLSYSAPFRSPHHTCTAEGLLGGGRTLKPGEVSLAHRGVLFLDEAPEFSPRLLQSLREPLEDGAINVVRAGRSVSFPARFQLVMTANSCPCGQLGREKGFCFCGPLEVRRYWDRVGGALIDRVDLRVFMKPARVEDVHGEGVDQGIDWESRVANAKLVQGERGQPTETKNAFLTQSQIETYCSISDEVLLKLSDRCRKEDWSSRAVYSLLKVARTIADLDARSSIDETDVDRAISLRKAQGEEYWQK